MSDAVRPVPWAFLGLMGGLAALGPFSIDLYLPAFPALRDHFGASEAAVQGTLSAYFLGLALGQLVLGPLADRYGRVPPLLLGLVVYVVASLGCALAPDLITLTALRFLQALGACAGMVVSRAVLRDLYEPQQMARVLSMVLLAMGLAPIVAPIMGSVVAEALGWPSLFVLLALYGAVLVVAVRSLLEETLVTPTPNLAIGRLLADYRSILHERRFVGYAFAGALAQSGMFAYIASSSFVFVNVYGFTPSAYAILFGTNAAGLIGASQINARLLRDRLPEQILPWTLGLYAASGSLLLLLVSLGLGGVFAVVLPLFVAIASLGFCFPNTTAAAMGPVANRAGMASALLGTIQFGLAGLSSFVAGWAFDGTALPMAVVMALTGWLALAALAAVPGNRPVEGAEHIG